MSTQYIHFIVAFIFGIVFPVYSILTGDSTKKMLLNSPEKKVYVYKQTIMFQFVLVSLVVFSLLVNEEKMEVIGLSFLFEPLWTLFLLSACFVGLWLVSKIEIDEPKVEKMINDYKEVIYILPTTFREYKWSVALSFVAGTLEEVIYRGYLFWILNQYIPIIPSILIVAIVFGLAHFGSNLKNMLSAVGLSLFLSLTYILTDSLLIAMLVHVLVDLYATTSSFKLCNKIKSLKTNTAVD